ncbi:MAG TPA: hypothetical protein VNF68_12850, partial [Candidatus Baltobacteraceae bacterium]|nr:hypothetical protein [Candidatus Baltobacteraceae bacterium]
MNNWFLRGLRAGIRTEGLSPGEEQLAPGLSQGMPQPTTFPTQADAVRVVDLCPTDALVADGSTVAVVRDRCVSCMRCKDPHGPAQAWRYDASWAHTPGEIAANPLRGRFAR